VYRIYERRIALKTAYVEEHKVDLIKLGILTILLIFLYYPTFSMFIYDWSNDENYSHGFLVPFIVGYLVWTKRDQLRATMPKPSLSGIFVLLGGVLIYIVGTIGIEWFVRRASLIIVLGGLILYLYGVSYFKILLFPLGYLIFMVPLPAVVYSTIAFRLQLLVSKVSAGVIALAGIPVYRNGNIIEVASGPLAVEEACSGMRSIMALLALSSLFAYILYRTKLRQWLLVASALPVAVVTNIIRVTVTGIAAHYLGREVAEGILHDSFGWIVFVLAFILLFLVSKLLNRILPEEAPTPPPATEADPKSGE
jgi:exosortase